jgi:hypothetical protein
MESPRQKSSLAHDPLGLLALPMISIGAARGADHGLRPGTKSAKPLGMAIAAKTLVGALVAVLIAVSLVSLPGPAKDIKTNAHCHSEGG